MSAGFKVPEVPIPVIPRIAVNLLILRSQGDKRTAPELMEQLGFSWSRDELRADSPFHVFYGCAFEPDPMMAALAWGAP